MCGKRLTFLYTVDISVGPASQTLNIEATLVSRPVIAGDAGVEETSIKRMLARTCDGAGMNKLR